MPLYLTNIPFLKGFLFNSDIIILSYKKAYCESCVLPIKSQQELYRYTMLERRCLGVVGVVSMLYAC